MIIEVYCSENISICCIGNISIYCKKNLVKLLHIWKIILTFALQKRI